MALLVRVQCGSVVRVQCGSVAGCSVALLDRVQCGSVGQGAVWLCW